MSRIVTTILLLFAGSFALPACVTNQAGPPRGPLPQDVIVVVGEGEVLGRPDVARLQLGVEAHAQDARAAVAAINGKVSAMIEALKQLGVAAEDLQTRDFNIHSEHTEKPFPVEEPGEPVSSAATSRPKPLPQAPPPAANESAPVASPPLPRRRPMAFVYRASNTLHVTVRELDRLGEILSRAVEVGANHAWGISFEIDDDTPLAKKAQAEAFADARAQAAELAELAGVQLGPVVSLLEAGHAGGPMPPMAPGFAMAEMRAVPTESGQLAVRRQVRVVFAIQRAD